MTDPAAQRPWITRRPGSTGQRADATGDQGGGDQSISRSPSTGVRLVPNPPAARAGDLGSLRCLFWPR